ncbi:MAG: hypothetical protein IPM53_10955 [Anaerolineaceae bacterium]|nr:hypothetical protein [Anaerolineaceae bacterium]
MAKITLNPLVKFIQGKVGDVVFKRQGDGVILTRRPVSKKRPSPAQLAQREKFKQATLYGRLVSADPARKAVYFQQSEARQRPMFSLMIKDFMNAPVVEYVDVAKYRGAVGDEIVVLADDDFGVVAVTVTISNSEGTVLTEGAAVETPVGSRRWVYVAETAVTPPVVVRVRAVDRPGNVGEKMVNGEW